MPFGRIQDRLSAHTGRVIATLFFLLAGLVSWVSLGQIRQHELLTAARSLQGVNTLTARVLQKQSTEAIAEATSLSTNAPVHELMLALLGTGTDVPASRYALRLRLAAWLVSHDFRDFYLLGPEGRIRAGFRDADLGKVVAQGVLDTLGDVLHGEGLITHPVLIGDHDVQMWMMVPVYDQGGIAAGVFAVVLDKQRHFDETTGLGQFGASTETYLVDRQGRMLTASRFENQLIANGRLKEGQNSELNMLVHVSGSNQPTLAVAHMLDGPDGMSITPYPDYRGVPVIGVWQWDRLFDAAIISEMDVDEALAGYVQTRNLILMLLAGLLLAGLIVARSYARYRRRQERESNELRNLLLESTAEAIYGLDLQGRCSFANKACVRMLGYEAADDLYGRNMHLLAQHSHADGTSYDEQQSRIFSSLRNKTRMHCREEVFWRRDGSSFPVEFWSHPLFDDGGEVVGCVVTFWDISELRKAEAQRNRIEKQIQHTQRLESLGVLAGGIAHDFNNILSAILGNAALASRKVISDPLDARERMESVVQCCDRASVLCRQMLAYSGKGKFVIRQINLSSMVEEITHLLEVSLDKGVVIKYSLAVTLPLVEADEAQMQQLIMNLVTNANEAIGGKSGVISITTGVMHADAEYLMDCYGDIPVAGRYTYVEVSDTGCGMDAETRQKIFDPFFTTKFTGRGLGMSAVLGIVRGHHGALKLYSEPGKGTTFKYLIPASDELATGEHEALELEDQWRGDGRLVLVVDDEETVRETAMMMLEDMGFTAVGAVNGLEALALYRSRQKEIAVVLMDLTMPKMGGEECFRELRRINPDVRVVLSSGYSEQDAIQTFTGKKLAGFVQKPVSPARLKQVIHAAVGDE
ncbi:histidine kinase [Mariprofundus ferrooxydans]|uniref:histidine kinase n=1 Tax=Mariprofundus ferrooxydans PV-1 TaxID=314345 RepID=Q0EZ67_9PROT|nr:sensory box histidine kinase/response regulator [Mariprofundus ferrooxydans PV-1]KON48832.1 histidine kinase [Mariprofundus ferrooxydans]